MGMSMSFHVVLLVSLVLAVLIQAQDQSGLITYSNMNFIISLKV